MEVMLDDLKKRVDHLQYDEIAPLKEEMNEVKIELNKNDFLTQQVMESNKKLNETMDTFKQTMVDISSSIKENNKISQQLANTVDELNMKVTKVEDNTNESINKISAKIDEVDSKSKFDIVNWARDNFISVLLTIGALGYIIYNVVH